MSGLVHALLISALVVLVLVRQFRTRRVSADRRWWIVPAVLVFLALREPGVIDRPHQAEAILLLGAELLTGVTIGFGWAWTTRMWAAPDGSVWSKTTTAGVAVWITGIGLRLGLFGVGELIHINNLFARTGLKDRAQAVRYAYGKGLVRPPGG